MEDEKGDVGLAFSGDASQSSVIANISSETVLGRVESGKPVEESYEEVAGEEVMVEIVGSDVFVDGVSGQKESDSVSGEAEDLEVNAWESRDLHSNVDALGEESLRKVEEVEHVAKFQDLGLVESVDSEGDAGSELPFRGVEIRSEEFCTSPIGPKVTSLETTESLSASFVKGSQQTCVLVSEEMKIDDNHIVEVVEEGCVVDETDTFHLGNSSTSCLDLFCANSVNSHEVANAGANGPDALPEASFNTHCEDPEKVLFDGFAGCVEEIGLARTSTVNPIHFVSNDPDNSMNLNLTMSATDAATSISGREVLATIISESEVAKASFENVYANGAGNNDAKINEDIIFKEKMHLCSKLDVVVPSIQCKSQCCVEDFNGLKCDTGHGIHDISHTALDSSQEWSPVNKHEEVMSMDNDSTLGFKDADLSCARNEACLNPDGDRETDEPIPVVVEVGSPEINIDKGNQIKTMSVMEDNLTNTANTSHKGEEEIVDPDSGGYMNEPIIDMSDPEVADEAEIETLPVNIVVQAESSKIDKKVHEVYTSRASIYTSASIVELSKFEESNDCSSKMKDSNFLEGGVFEFEQMDIEEREFGQNYTEQEVDCRDSDLETDETASEAENSRFLTEELVKSAGSISMNQLGYFSPPENEGEFSLFDLVWGKVRSYPWWPGQIFDPSDASEKAVKYFKKDSYLVAYFGDRTFAWNDASVLKPFRSNFSQIEKQGSSEAFHNAVNCVLDEISRRVELGLTCSCVPKDAYDKIKTQLVENTGIREESSQRNGVDQSSRAVCFEPSELLEYIQDLAPLASSRANQLDLVIAQSQLLAFSHFKGYRLPTEFPLSGELLENDADEVEINDEIIVSPKNKHILKDSLQFRKERSLTELMSDSPDFEDYVDAADLSKSVFSPSGKKRKALDPLSEGLDKKVSVYAKGSTSTNQSPKPSFKIGECIRRVASQLTGSTSIIKSQIDETGKDGFLKLNEYSERQNMIVSAESSLDEMLFQLQLLAQSPKKEHNFLNRIAIFFSGFRSSIALNRRGKKNRSANAVGVSAEEFEFDDVNDSYWTDRIVQNNSEGQLLHNCENGGSNLQVVPFDAEKCVKSGRKTHSRKRFSMGSYQEAAAAVAEFDEIVKRRKQESSPAELILNFAEGDSVPSEINLNKMFRRFGPLMESETEVDHDSGRAKVIFKRGSDAEVAHNSAEKFNIFGPMHVNYEIGYSPLISIKILPVVVPQCLEDPTVMI